MLLGIDLGTSSVKVLLMTATGTVLGEGSSAYPVRSPQPGWAESDPQDWWAAVAIAVRAATAEHGHSVTAIGLSGQMHGVVLCDAVGTALYPAILWADARSAGVLARYQTLEQVWRDRLSNPITTGMAGVSLLWLQQHQPAISKVARWALQPKDWLRLRLTDVAATEPSDASGTLMYDVAGDRWFTQLLHHLDLRTDWLPDMIPSSQVAGYLTPSAAAHLDLPTGIPVVAGAADTAAALLGNGLRQPGIVQLTIGTGAQLATVRDRPISDPHGNTHLFRTALPQQWYALAAMQNAGLALEWVRQILGMTWTDLYDATSLPPGCAGLIFLPYLTGDRTPHLDPQPLGAWVGLGLHHSRAHLARSALEGVAFSIRQGLDALVATGITVTELRLAGGGSLNSDWRQLLADVLQVPLHSTERVAASARGAALLAGLGTGLYADAASMVNPTSTLTNPDQITQPRACHPDLQTAWEQFCALYSPLQQICHRELRT
jgi:xylulokinase